MTLAGRVVAHLGSHGVSAAVIGGVAMALHGIARATIDLDLLVVDTKVLDASHWNGLRPDVAVRVSKGDASDPLAGVVRCTSSDGVVDVVVGSHHWMDDVISRAIVRDVVGERLPVVDAADLVFLKLYAGGPQDLLDVRLLFEADAGLGAVVQARIGSMPSSVIARLKLLS